MTAYIGYENAFEQDGVTITHTDEAGFETSNVYDYKTHTQIKKGGGTIDIDAGSGNTITANYLAVIAHNLQAEASQVILRHSSDDITYTDFLSNTGNNDKVIFEYAGTTPDRRYWQIAFTGSTSSLRVGHISFGLALECRPIGTGFKPPVYEHYDSINAQGQAANYLGRSIKRVPMDLRIRQQGIDPAALRTDWVPFLQHAACKPFFFTWDYENYPDEAVYCWTEKPQQPTYTSLCHASIDLAVKAIKA